MKINNLKINGFGKLENKDIKFDKNINIIYGENEAGKTTLLKFINGMFYGISKNKNKKELPEYGKYLPWNNAEYSGKLEYELDNHEKYEIFREFNKKNPQIFKDSKDISKNFNIDKTKGNDFFYEQTKIDETMFKSTTLIEQKEVILDNDEQTILTQKIANLMSTGEENISYKKTINVLNKKMLDEVGTARTVGKPINLINTKIENINKEIENIKNLDEEKNQIEKKQKTIQDKIQEKKIKIDLIKKIISIKNEEKIEEEKIKINNELINEEKIKINKINEKINSEKINKKNNYFIYLFILIILIIINLIFLKIKLNKIINIILFFILIIYLFYLIFKINKNKKIINKEKDEKNKLIIERKNLEENINKIQDKINQINSNQIQQEKMGKNGIKVQYKDHIDEEEINYLLTESLGALNKIIDNMENELNGFIVQLHTNEFSYNNIIKKYEEKSLLEEEIQNANEEKNNLIKLENSINIAKTALENAYEKMKNEVTPKFTKDLSNIINKVSNGKYNKINFIDGEGLNVELSNGKYINANQLSVGTIDQLYLSLRLSAMNIVSKEKMPIILDESFAYYDDCRLENILLYINENFSENQVLIFTCSERERKILEKNNIKYNYILMNN